MVSALKRLSALAFGAVVLFTAGLAQAQQGSFVIPDRPVWVGEVFDTGVDWRVDWSTFQNLEGPPEWKSDPLVTEPLGAPALVGPSTAGGATIGLRTRGMALRPGTITLQPVRQNMVLKVGAYQTDEYSRAITAARMVQSARGTVRVRPLPAPPEGFTGAVGQFTAVSKVDKTALRVGDSLIWTVTVTGLGNWPMIKGLPARAASRDFDVIGQPKIVEEDRGEAKPPASPVPGAVPVANLFERAMSEEVVLSPTRAGRYVLSAFEMVAFDPKTGRYYTVGAPPITLEIAPGPNGEGTEPIAAAPEPKADALAEDGKLPPFAPGRAGVVAPPPHWLWLTALGVLPLLLAGLWVALALHRAYMADPDRVARGADVRLRKTLARLQRSADPVERRRLVRAWQTDVALRWKFGSLAPTPRSFGVLVGWSALWAEADRFLYARQGHLPDDWSRRALAQLDGMDSLEPFKPLTAFERGNVWPIAAALLLSLALWTPQLAHAQQHGLKALQARVVEAPRDWKAHYNLAISLAAQKKWEEAAAQAAIAYVQAPASPRTQALWTHAAQEAGSSLEPGASVPRPRGWESRIVGALSPALWRWLALALAWLAAGGVAVILLARFGRIARRLRHLGSAMIAVAVVGGAVTSLALSAWGPVSRAEAVLVWKAGPMRAVPVDTAAEQAPYQLAAGTAGYVDRAWLGWRHVRLGDGRSGWLRQETLLWVWSKPR